MSLWKEPSLSTSKCKTIIFGPGVKDAIVLMHIRPEEDAFN